MEREEEESENEREEVEYVGSSRAIFRSVT